MSKLHASNLRVLAWPANAPGNAYIRLLYEHMRAFGVEVTDFSPARALFTSAEIWHLHWPESPLRHARFPRAFLRMTVLLGLIVLARLRGTTVIWTAHNLDVHESSHPRLERWFWKGYSRVISGFISLTEGALETVRSTLPALRRRPGVVVPHGHYRGAYADSTTREEARATLGIAPEASVTAFVGQIRPYKNVPHLIRAFRSLPHLERHLLIAGKPSTEALAKEVKAAAAEDTRVSCFLGFIPDDAVQLYLHAADLVVLPYRDILNSGSVLLALSFDCPVLVPRKGAMEELRAWCGAEWIRTYSGELTTAELEEAIAWVQTGTPYRGQCTALDELNWHDLACRTVDAYRDIRQTRGSPSMRRPLQTYQAA
ncbi:MAG: glycosyltransferase family 4 protein [Gemmatimonadetes bacterium]|nr:glycosyltransferase family 4 protein [Gemmatimonadota bacterium]